MNQHSFKFPRFTKENTKMNKNTTMETVDAIESVLEDANVTLDSSYPTQCMLFICFSFVNDMFISYIAKYENIIGVIKACLM